MTRNAAAEGKDEGRRRKDEQIGDAGGQDQDSGVPQKGKLLEDEWTDLGPCCICERTGPEVRNVLALPHPSPTPGRGWGCFVCGLPSNGALAVVCDECLDRYHDGLALKHVCTGFPGEDGRTSFEEMSQEAFEHDLSRHPDRGDWDRGSR